MDQAGRALLGEHDFLSYCRPREGATTIRTLRTLRWERPGPGLADEGLVVATIEADAFCHHMVRSLVGALMAVGEGGASRSGRSRSSPPAPGSRPAAGASARLR